jgi:succinate dehydrogenase/fumarate reductase cytochrome b subunit
VALFFIALHVATFWLPLRLGQVHVADAFTLLRANLSATLAGIPAMGLAYALGLSACIFHFANGLRSFATRWGLVTSRRGRGRMSVVAVLVGAALFAGGAPAVVYLATGWRLIGQPVNVDAGDTVCEVSTAGSTEPEMSTAAPSTSLPSSATATEPAPAPPTSAGAGP